MSKLKNREKCLNTNTLGIVIYQSRYLIQGVCNIQTYHWCSSSILILCFFDTPLQKTLRRFGLRVYHDTPMNFLESGIEIEGIEVNTPDQTNSTLDYTEYSIDSNLDTECSGIMTPLWHSCDAHSLLIGLFFYLIVVEVTELHEISFYQLSCATLRWRKSVIDFWFLFLESHYL